MDREKIDVTSAVELNVMLKVALEKYDSWADIQYGQSWPEEVTKTGKQLLQALEQVMTITRN